MVKCCAIKNCKSESYFRSGISFHQMTKDPEIKEQWQKHLSEAVINKEKAYLCHRHFKTSDFIPNTITCNIRKLKPKAVPTIFPWMPEWKQYESSEDDDSDAENSDGDSDAGSDYKPSNDDDETNCETDDDNTNEIKPKKSIRSFTIVDKKFDCTESDDSINEATQPTNQKNQHFISVKRFSPIEWNMEPVTRIDNVNENPNNQGITKSNSILQSLLNKQSKCPIKQNNNVMVVKPINEEERIEDIISIEAGSHFNRKGYFDKDMFKECLHEDIEEVVRVNNRKTVRKADMQTQTKNCECLKSDALKKRVTMLQRSLLRRTTSYNQVKAILKLIKQCKDFTQVQQVLSLKLNEVPENENSDQTVVPKTDDKKS